MISKFNIEYKNDLTTIGKIKSGLKKLDFYDIKSLGTTPTVYIFSALHKTSRKENKLNLSRKLMKTYPIESVVAGQYSTKSQEKDSLIIFRC